VHLQIAYMKVELTKLVKCLYIRTYSAQYQTLEIDIIKRVQAFA